MHIFLYAFAPAVVAAALGLSTWNLDPGLPPNRMDDPE